MKYEVYRTLVHVPLRADSWLAAGRLLIYIQSHKLYYVLISAKGQIVGCKEFQLMERSMGTTMFLRLVFETDPLLRAPYADCRVFAADIPFSLLPDRWKKEAQILPLARLLLDDWVFEDELFLRKVPDLNMHLMFQYPSNLKHVLDHYLSHYTLSHVAQTCLNLSARLWENQSSLLFVQLLSSHILIVACKQSQVQLCNQYHFQSPEDILYYLQVVKEVCGMEGLDIPVYVCGETSEPNLIAERLQSQIARLSFPILPNSPFPHPEPVFWRYGFLAAAG